MVARSGREGRGLNSQMGEGRQGGVLGGGRGSTQGCQTFKTKSHTSRNDNVS